MTTHVVSMSFDIDDSDIKRRVEQSAEQRIINQLVDDVRKDTCLTGRWERDEMKAEVAKIIAEELVDEVRDEVIKRCVSGIVSRKAFIEAVSGGFLQEFMRESLKEAE